jgi:integrase
LRAFVGSEQNWRWTPANRARSIDHASCRTRARGAEVLADSKNERRTGLHWRDVDLNASEARVLGKSQDIETVVLLEPATTRLHAHKRRQDPPHEDWPVFPTTHLPSLYGALPDGVNGAPETVHDLLREHDATPPSLSTNGGRTVLRRLSAESGITVEGEHLKPHGARRGLGDALYNESAELAQEMLRHQSIETTHGAYRDRDTERTRTAAEKALGSETADDE